MVVFSTKDSRGRATPTPKPRPLHSSFCHGSKLFSPNAQNSRPLVPGCAAVLPRGAAPGKSEGRFWYCQKNNRTLPYSSARGVSGVLTNSPSLSGACLTGFGANLVFRRRGCVCFSVLNSLRYFAKVSGFISMPFACNISVISWASMLRFFNRSSVGARRKRLLAVRLRLPWAWLFAGLSLAKSAMMAAKNENKKYKCRTVYVTLLS